MIKTIENRTGRISNYELKTHLLDLQKTFVVAKVGVKSNFLYLKKNYLQVNPYIFFLLIKSPLSKKLTTVKKISIVLFKTIFK